MTGCEDGKAALNTIIENPDTYDLVITDQAMPHMTGKQLVEALHEIVPHLPVILCTGYSNLLTPKEVDQLNVIQYFTKPVKFHELSQAIHSVLSEK